MSSINWNDGQLVTLNEGDTATCNGGLNKGQLYCLFFYNAAGHDASTAVSVVWSQSQPPVTVNVPGTTQNQGLAALCFVNGDQTNTVSAAVTSGNQGADVQAFIGSVKMPTNTAGINNKQLPLDGSTQTFLLTLHPLLRGPGVPLVQRHAPEQHQPVHLGAVRRAGGHRQHRQPARRPLGRHRLRR